MGRIKDYIAKALKSKVKATIFDSVKPLEPLLGPEPIVPDIKVHIPFEMTPGLKLTPEEKIEENKYLIEKLDYKVSLILKMIDDFNPEEDSLSVVAQDPGLMRLWLAHTSYKTRINDFLTLIIGKNINALSPDVLAPKVNKISKPKKVKCLTDLPLQKKLLN